MIKKLLTYAVVITTAVWSVGLLATPLAVGAAVSGDLIKLQCAAGADVNDPCRAVYYLGADSKRYVFPNQATYMTWYPDFSGVQIVSSTEMSSYPIGGNVTYRPGVKLVKITTDPKVYAVSKNGTLHWVTTGAIAEALYGANWPSMVNDVADSFFVNYTVGSDITNAADYDKQGQMDGSTTINEDKNLGSAVSTGTSLTASLAADTPATGIVIGNTVNNKFTKVNLTAASDGDITVNQIVVRRGGTVASDGAFDSVALLDGNTGLRIGNTRTLNNQHLATFNLNLTIPAGTTRSIYLVGNMGDLSTKAGEIPTLDLYSVGLTGNAVVIGALPIVGNYQNLNGTITVGGLTLGNGSNNPLASDQKVGTTNYIVSGVRLNANNVENFRVSHISFNQGGTASINDVKNLKLLVNDVVVSSSAVQEGRFVHFNLSANPILIEKGKNVQVDLAVDIESGSGRTIRFDIERESDVRAVGQTYGSEVKVGAGTGASANAIPFWTAPVTDISEGSLQVSTAPLTAGNVSNDTDQVTLGKFEIEARGEAVEITRLPLSFNFALGSGNYVTATSTLLTNITVYNASGAIVAGPVDPIVITNALTGKLGATSTDSFVVPVGKNVYTVKADTSDEFKSGATVTSRMYAGGIVGRGDVTGLTVDVAPTTAISSVPMTVQAANLAVAVQSSNPVAQTVVAGTQNHTFATINLNAQSSGEDIRVTRVRVAVKGSGATVPPALSNWTLMEGSTQIQTSNLPSSNTVVGNNATVTFDFSTPLVVGKGTSKNLTVKANIALGATGSVRVGMADSVVANHITARGAVSNADAALTLNVNDGQLQTLTGTGNLIISRSTTPSQPLLLPASTSGLAVGSLNLVAQNEAVNIEKITLTGVAINSGGFDQVENIHLYNGSTKVASTEGLFLPADGVDQTVTIDVTGNPIVVPVGQTLNLQIKVDTSGSNNETGSKGASGQGVMLKIDGASAVTAKGAQSGTEVSLTVTNASTTPLYLFRSVPIVTTNDQLQSGERINGGNFTASQSNVALYRFKVKASVNNPVGLSHVSFRVATSTATVTSMRISDGSNNVGFTSTNGLHFDDGVVTFFFVNNGTAPAANNSSNVVVYELGANEEKTFTLFGDIVCTSGCSGTSGSGSVNVSFLGDADFASPLPGTKAQVLSSNFAWTDFWRTPSLGANASNVFTEAQWSNGRFVPRALPNSQLEAESQSVGFSK